MNNFKWKIFIVTHGPIISNYYNVDLFSNQNFEFINVSNTPIQSNNFSITSYKDISPYVLLGKWYAESEVIYNIYKSNKYKEYDYIGFLHWDYQLLSPNKLINDNTIGYIQKAIENNETFISFSSFKFSEDFQQNILMDTTKPNELVGFGNNCYNEIISDYNTFFNTSYNLEFFIGRYINLCSAFLCKKSIFENMMSFISNIIESRKLDLFDTEHKNRFQGGMIERYIGIYSAVNGFYQLELIHNYIHHKRDKNNLLKRIICHLIR